MSKKKQKKHSLYTFMLVYFLGRECVSVRLCVTKIEILTSTYENHKE